MESEEDILDEEIIESLLQSKEASERNDVSGGPSNELELGPESAHFEEATVGSVVRYMYCSHFLSKWGDRMWEFAVALFMIQIWEDSLILTALYGLVEAGSVAIFGVFVGEWVDANPRMKVVRLSIAIQNASIIGAAVGVILLLTDALPGAFNFIALVFVVNLLGGVQALAGLANNIAVERDWVVVVSKQAKLEDQSTLLSSVNATMRRIDLSCKLLAPVAAGLLMSLKSTVAAAVFIAFWNALSTIGEYYFLHIVYIKVPALSQKECIIELQFLSEREGQAEEGEGTLLNSQSEDTHRKGQTKGEKELLKKLTAPITTFLVGWSLYIKQETAPAGVALAFLYFTVLSFGSLMTAVLSWRGISPLTLGLARAVAALVGILATVCYPVWHRRVQGLRTGLRAIWLQWTCLLPCLISIWLSDPAMASWLLIGGVTCSRLGLWMFDLSVMQLMQESIHEAERGVVGGVQSSLQEVMSTASFLAGILISHPRDFSFLIGGSFLMVFLAAIVYTLFCRARRGHLFHPEKLKLTLPIFGSAKDVELVRSEGLRLRAASSLTSPAA